jgi:hypothetical protein
LDFAISDGMVGKKRPLIHQFLALRSKPTRLAYFDHFTFTNFILSNAKRGVHLQGVQDKIVTIFGSS